MKRFISLVMTICMVTMFGSSVYADPAATASTSVGAIQTSVTKIVNAVSYLGYAVAIAMLAYLAMKYAMAPANEKADVKQGSVNYLIGAFLIICASSIALIFVKIATGGDANPTTDLATTIIQAAQNATAVN